MPKSTQEEITKKIDVIIEFIYSLASGDLSHRLQRVDEDSNENDLDSIVEGLNMLAEELEELERRVKERTENLKTAVLELETHGLVLEHMLEGVNVSDENGKIIYTNPAFEAMFGYERDELLGQHVSVLNAESEEANDSIVQNILKQLKSKGVWKGEFNNLRKDGTLFKSSATISVLEVGHKNHWISVQEDITERRLEEQKFQKLLESAPDTMVMVNQNNKIVLLQQAS